MNTRQRAELAITGETKKEGLGMTIRSSKEKTIWGERTRTLAAGLLMAALMTMCLVLAAGKPAHAATTFTVNLPGDTHDADLGDSLCDVNTFGSGQQCTLRAAIEQANSTLGADAIHFDIPDDFGAGVKTINVGATGNGALPHITGQLTIDGYTQPGASPNTKAVGDDAALKIELNGTNASGASGLDLSDSSGSVIKGLVINRFDTGIFAFFDTAIGNRIQGNFIGTDPTGTLDEGNQSGGVNLVGGPSNNVVGGTTPAARNIISGNGGFGVSVGDDTSANLIQGNYVGTDKSGTKDLGNDESGVRVATGIAFVPLPAGNTVGGTTAASRNLVSGNRGNGIEVFNSQGTKVLGNRVGTTADGKGALGNDEDGVSVAAGFANLIGDGTAGGSNTVAFNADNGVEVYGLGTTGIEISHNSVFSNAGIGIDLGTGSAGNGPTPNDLLDTDEGPNNLQNKPAISSAKTVSGKTTIAGKLSSAQNRAYTIEFYANPSDTNEGKKYIGEKSVKTSGDGLRTFTFTPATAVSAGQTITATATRNATNVSLRDTSEFSAARTVASS